MFDAVGSAIEQRRAAVAHRRSERFEGTKNEDSCLGLCRMNGRGLLDRKGTLLDGCREEAYGHRTAIELGGMIRDKIRIRLAIRRQFL